MAREPATRRGRRFLAERSSKLVENPKTAMFIKGPSTSQHVTDIMTEFVRSLQLSFFSSLANSLCANLDLCCTLCLWTCSRI